MSSLLSGEDESVTSDDIQDLNDRRDVLLMTLAEDISEMDRPYLDAELAEVLTMLSIVPQHIAPVRPHSPMC